MNMQINLDNLKEIYLVSNTASFLYSGFIKEESLLELKAANSQEDLINHFEEITKREIDKIDELVLAYSIYVAILLFDNETTFNFLNTKGNINFEWFPELKHLYISRLKTFNFNKLEVKDFQSSSQKIYNESSIDVNNQTIEFA